MVERSERLSQLTESFLVKTNIPNQGIFKLGRVLNVHWFCTFNPKMSHGSGGKLAKLMCFGRNRQIR